MNDCGYKKAAFNTKVTVIENKTPLTTGFVTTPEFNGLTKYRFDARMKQETKSLVSKNQVNTTFDIADKKEKKQKNFRRLI